MHPWKLQQLAHELDHGAIIAYPTETLWGLGCLPTNSHSLLMLANIKQRSLDKGFILISPNLTLCLPYIHPSFHSLAKQKISINFNQPTTWLAPKADAVLPLLSGKYNTIAIRISPHPFVNDICNIMNAPLVSTSANINKQPSLNSPLLIKNKFRGKVRHIVHGYEKGSGAASSIIELESGFIIR